MADPKHPQFQTPLPGLSPIATASDRVSALLSIGLAAGDLRAALGVSEATLRNWVDEATMPRHAASRTLDDLRAAVLALYEAGLEGEQAARWLTSRQLNQWLRGHRPVDVVRDDPYAVLAAIQDLLAEPQPSAAPVVQLQVKQSKKSAIGHASAKRRRRQAPGRH
jgi:hypothetical protein